MPLHRSVLLPLVLSALPASRAAAQSPLHAQLDATVVHDYRWRGIQRASGWNAQLEGSARAGGHKTGLAVGVWSNFEALAWDDQEDVVVQAVGKKERGYEWSVTVNRVGLVGHTLHLRLPARHGQPAHVSEAFPGCPGVTR